MIKKCFYLSFVAISVLNANSTTRLDDVVISSVGFEEKIVDTVKNISIITKEDIQNKGFSNIKDILKRSPGVSISSKSVHGDQIDIRGQGDKASSSVLILVDGVSINSLDQTHVGASLDTVDINNIERIEIIPGGGSVLYGSGTRGGVVNIITTKASKNKEFHGYLTAKYASYKHKEYQANLSKSISENIFLDTSFQKLNKKGYTNGTKDDKLSANASLKFDISDNQELILNASYAKSELVVAKNQLTKEQLKEDRKQAPLGIHDSEITQYSEYISRKRKYDLKYTLAQKNFSLETLSFYQKLTMKDRIDKNKGLKFKFKVPFEKGYLVSGYDYEKMKAQRGEENITKVQKETNSLFLIGKYNFNEYVNSMIGYRKEYASYTMQNTENTINGNTKANNDAYEFVLNSKYSDDGNIYFKYEKGFISPTPYKRYDKTSVTPLEYEVNNIKSEDYDTYEIGIRDFIFGSYITLTNFYSISNNEIMRNMHSDRSFNWENIDETKRYGVELFLEQYPTNNLTFNQSYSFINAEITKGEDKGDDIPYVSKNKFVFSMNYYINSKLSTYLDYQYFGSSYDKEKVKVPSYSIANLSLNYEFNSQLSFVTGVNNLLNKEYNEYQSTRNGKTTYRPAPERNYFFQLKYNF